MINTDKEYLYSSYICGTKVDTKYQNYLSNKIIETEHRRDDFEYGEMWRKYHSLLHALHTLSIYSNFQSSNDKIHTYNKQFTLLYSERLIAGYAQYLQANYNSHNLFIQMLTTNSYIKEYEEIAEYYHYLQTINIELEKFIDNVEDC